MTDAARILAGAGPLSEYDAKRVLAAYGLPVCREGLATTAEQAAAIAAGLGYPVVMKGCAAEVAHKTELGLVELGVADAADAARRFAALRARLPAGGAVLVQETVRGRRELILGVVRDPQFGPCVSVGVGGVFAEVLDDLALRVAPVDRDEALAMLDDLRHRALLGPFRGEPAVDRDVLADALVGLSRLALDHPRVREVDVNPLIVGGDGRPVAVDALIVLDDQT
ncbi:MAG: acetate--CoA ligase family protein [Hyphomicrobiales bacterium]|nr:acetate--CoA ligase family protein [Hyphomicrobiales bacterium]MCP5370298.1 acetate--CoA ligase family protein [Hyphomicrobiales bacterium]